VTSIGGWWISVHTNFKFSIHSNTAWVKHDEVSQKMGKVIYKGNKISEKVSNKWKPVGQTGHHENTEIQFYIQTVDVQTGELEVFQV
jgi:hypothetical protein